MDKIFSKQQADSIPRGPLVTVSLNLPRPAKKNHKKLWLSLLALGCVALISAVALAKSAQNWSSQSFIGAKKNLFNSAADFIRGSIGQITLQGEHSGTIRVLLLGIGGEGHDGPYLSDTIILAQIKPTTNEIALTSIPRDYLVKLPQGLGERKINAAFAEGFNRHKDWNEAGSWARFVVSELSGLEIPYFAVVDFRGFEKAIDKLGGIDVKIEKDFTDYQYPNSSDGYLPPQSFKAGTETMNGKRALVFARSRHAAGPEGSDFARSKRQKQVIEAARSKALKLNPISDSKQIASLLDTFAQHFHTNLTPGQLIKLLKIGQASRADIASSSLEPSTGLICPNTVPETGAFVLRPCYGKSKTDIMNFFSEAFLIGRLAAEASVVWIATPDARSYAYKQLESQLTGLGLTIWPISYSDTVPEESVVYEVNSKPAATEYLTRLLHAREVTLPPPHIKIDATRSDIIVVLGNNLPENLKTAPSKPQDQTTEPAPASAATATPGSQESNPAVPSELSPPKPIDNNLIPPVPTDNPTP